MTVELVPLNFPYPLNDSTDTEMLKNPLKNRFLIPQKLYFLDK
jgi:hypothetical protein